MVRRNATVTTESLPGGDTPDFLTLDIDELDEVLAGLPSEDASINLYRVNPQGKPAFIMTFPARDFSLEVIKNTYGGGKYKYVAKAGGVAARQGMFEIEGEPIGGRPRSAWFKFDGNGRRVFAKAGEPGAFQVGDETPVYLPPEPVNQPAAGIDPITFLMQEIRELKLQLQNKPADNEETIMKRMLMYKQLFSEEKKSPSEDFVKNSIELLKQGIELGANAEGGGGTPWYLTLFEKAMPMLQQVVTAVSLQSSRTNGTIASVRNPAPSSASTQAENPTMIDSPQSGFAAIVGNLQPFLPTFLQSASRNVDPGNLVDITVANIPAQQVSIVTAWLESPTWFQDLCSMSPLIQAQESWWQEYATGLLQALKNPEGDHDENS